MEKLGRSFSYLLIFFFIFGIYTSFLTKDYSQADFIRADIIRGASLNVFLLTLNTVYNFISFLFWNMLKFFSKGINILLSIQILNSIFGVMGILVFYRLLRDVIDDKIVSMPVTLGLGFSYGYWRLSTGCTEDSLEIFLLLTTIFIIWKTIKKNKFILWVYLGIAHSLATVANHSNSILILAVLANLFLVKDKILNRLKCVFGYMSTFLPILLIHFSQIHVVQSYKNFTEYFFTWIFLKGPAAHHFKFTLSGISHIIFQHFKVVAGGSIFFDKLRAFKFDFLAAFLFSLALVIALVFAYLFFVLIKDRKAIFKNYYKIIAIAILFMISFSFIYATGQQKSSLYLIRNMIPIWLIMGIVIGHLKDAIKEWTIAVVFTLPFLLFTINFFGGVLQNSDVKNIDEFQFISFFDDYVKPEDLILLSNAYNVDKLLQWYINYFTDRNVARINPAIQVDKAIKNKIDNYIQSKAKTFWIATLQIQGDFNAGDIRSRNILEKMGYRLVKIATYYGRNVYYGSSIYQIKH